MVGWRPFEPALVAAEFGQPIGSLSNDRPMVGARPTRRQEPAQAGVSAGALAPWVVGDYTRTMHVAIVSDTICPWCYIGKRRFERAHAGRPAELTVEWRPFQLNPDMPAEGVDRQRYMVAKFGFRGAGNGDFFGNRAGR